MITHLETWSQWWPSVRRVAPVSAGTPDGGLHWEFRFRTRLPYDMGFVAQVLQNHTAYTGEARVAGRVVGKAAWRVEPVDGGARVCFEWEVRPQLGLDVEAVAPLARAVFQPEPPVADGRGRLRAGPPPGHPAAGHAGRRAAPRLTRTLFAPTTDSVGIEPIPFRSPCRDMLFTQ